MIADQQVKAEPQAMQPKEEEDEEEPMESGEWLDEIKSLLDSTYSKGEVSTGREIQMPGLYPKIVVDDACQKQGYSRLAFPLLKSQACALIESTATEKAPFGKGRDTVLDENVRKLGKWMPAESTF
ncbi:unnamed protein product [Cylindrotheca closterium]|uniref:Uncharacterized protein n=1 Tax=Cylindrotheca closterium TaxID=2856 RepID=A0AAD2FHG1_9STRA|nr:unnamed protein product [Cylindrotheca closterium]